jgi:hypothetical protein
VTKARREEFRADCSVSTLHRGVSIGAQLPNKVSGFASLELSNIAQ